MKLRKEIPSASFLFKFVVEFFNHTFESILIATYNMLIESGKNLINMLCQIPMVKNSDDRFIPVNDLNQIPFPVKKNVEIKLETKNYTNKLNIYLTSIQLKNWLYLAKSVPEWETTATFLLAAILNSNPDNFESINHYLGHISGNI
jgi:hypothetical protein